jgi:AAA family ATP:ADP antiporter
MADTWHSDQAKRLYGFIAAGGSAGAICGPLVTHSLVHVLGPTNLLLVSSALLGLAMVCAHRLQKLPDASPAAPPRTHHSVSDLLAGARHVVASPYLRNIALWVLLANLIGTFFYFEQTRIVGAFITERADRVQYFARLDLAVNTLTVLTQLWLTGYLMRRMGVGASIAALPLSAALGLVVLAAAPLLPIIAIVMVVERAITFAISNPALRVLYTLVEPEDKYKAQNFIDTVVFRGGDAASGWIINGLARGLGAPMALVAVMALPFAAVWLALSLRLGHEQAARAEAAATVEQQAGKPPADQ